MRRQAEKGRGDEETKVEGKMERGLIRRRVWETRGKAEDMRKRLNEKHERMRRKENV